MSVPGLAILYAGLMKRKWAVNCSQMVLYGFRARLVAWSFWGHKMAFGTQITDALHFVGVPGSMLSPSGEQGQAVMPARVVALLFILLYDGLAIGDVAVPRRRRL